MKRPRSGAVFLLLLGAVAAQDKQGKGEPSPAKKRLQELETEYRQTITDWQAKMKEAAKAAEGDKQPGKTIPAMPMRPDFSAVRKKCMAAATEFHGDDAVDFLLMANNTSATADERREALEPLFRDHLDSPRLAAFGQQLGYLDQMVNKEFAEETIERIEKHAKNAALLGWVVLHRNEKTLRGQLPSSEAFKTAKATVAAAVEKAGDKNLRRQFDSIVAEQEKFALGLVAPEIEGVDLDGVAFKLSDYKGKVVFLDFWGDW